MLDVHAEALERSNTAYHEFLLYYRNDARLVYGFVEGREDPVFYRGLIEQLLDDGWNIKLIMAGNKRRVLENLNQMDWARFPRKRICFFVDRDLSDYLDEHIPQVHNFYVTDGYSAENSVVNESALERALEELFGIQGMAPIESEEIRKRFRASFASFETALLPVMGQILVWRKAKQTAYLENIRLNCWFKFHDGKLESLEACCSDTARLTTAAEWCKLPPSDEAEICVAVAQLLERNNAASILRGKYAMWFFVQFVQNVRDNIGSFCGKYKNGPPKSRVSLGVENAMALMANRIRIPHTLKKFVLNNYIEFIQGIPG